MEIARDEMLVVRRVVGRDGRSRAFVNDQPVSVGFLRRLGQALVEVHGQHDQHGLLNPASHRDLLDTFAGLGRDRAAVASAYAAWREAQTALDEARKQAEAARREEDLLRHAVEELEALAPEAGEEERLAERRQTLINGEKITEAVQAAIAEVAGDRSVEDRMMAAQRLLDRVAESAHSAMIEEAAAALERAAIEAAEAVSTLERYLSEVDLDPGALEAVEERLFGLRGAARKHQVEVDELPALLRDLTSRLDLIENTDARLAELEDTVAARRAAYLDVADRLSDKRAKAAVRLARAVAAELKPLRMEKVVFEARLEPLDESQWGADGKERVQFVVSTNPARRPARLRALRRAVSCRG